jgi:phage-related protein
MNEQPAEKPDMFSVGTIRPQILVGILCGTIIAIMGMWIGYWMSAIEIITGIIGTAFGFLMGIGFKILEKE